MKADKIPQYIFPILKQIHRVHRHILIKEKTWFFTIHLKVSTYWWVKHNVTFRFIKAFYIHLHNFQKKFSMIGFRKVLSSTKKAFQKNTKSLMFSLRTFQHPLQLFSALFWIWILLFHDQVIAITIQHLITVRLENYEDYKN